MHHWSPWKLHKNYAYNSPILFSVIFVCATAKLIRCFFCAVSRFRFSGTIFVTGKSLDGPEKGMSTKCPKNVETMSENVRKCPTLLKTLFSDIIWTFLAYLVDAFVW